MKGFWFILFIVSLVCHSSYAQFNLMGNAQYMSPDCIQLTPDLRYQEGLAYYTTKLNLAGYFEIEFDIFLGADDMGADGMTFVIHNDPRGFDAYGTWGECMGYGRWNPNYLQGNYISPSIAVEFDTYQNFRQNDPSFDHIAYLENGTNYHTFYWHNDNPDYNLEDDKLHNFRFRWEADTHTLTVFLDDQVVYEGQKDLVKDVFEGETYVIWGFTASTGNKHNLQYFCLRNLAVKQGDDSSIFKGE